MKSVYPNKLFEYISSNIPVITTALPELEIYNKYLGFSKNNIEFLDNCRKAVKGEYLTKMLNYNEILEKNSWGYIINEIIQVLNAL